MKGPLIKALMALGMGRGPDLAPLRSGSAFSLSIGLALSTNMGWKKAAVYALIVCVMGAFTGWMFGFFVA